MEPYLSNMVKTLQTGQLTHDRTGVGTFSVFGMHERYDISDNKVPVPTTKEVHLKSIIHELIWMLSGDTRLEYLIANGVRIWNEWVKPGTEVYAPLTMGELEASILKFFKSREPKGIKDVTLFPEWMVASPCGVRKDFDSNLEFGLTKDITIDWLDNGGQVTVTEKENSFYVNAPADESPLYYGLLVVAYCYDLPINKLVGGELGPVYGKVMRAIEDIKETPGQLDGLGCVDMSALTPPVGFTRADYRGSYINVDGELKDVWKRTIDQVSRVLDSLKNDVHSRRHIVNNWHVPYVEEQALPPCHTLYQFYVDKRSTQQLIARLHEVRPKMKHPSWLIGASDKEMREYCIDAGVKEYVLSCQLYMR